MGAQMSWIFLCHRHVGGCACYHCKNFAKVRWQLYQGCNDFSDVKHSDDSGINAIRLRCSGGKELISAEGIEGGWTSWKLSRSNSPIFEVHIRSQPPGECNCFNFGECDDTATNGLRFEDSRGTIYEPYVNFYEHANWEGLYYYRYLAHKLHGYWASVTCPAGKFITGFRTQVEPDQGGGDDTGLNGVQFQCNWL